jgi:ABC-type amino acid transport system permease subunit
MSEARYVGVDPGANGCAAVLNEAGEVVAQVKFKDATPHDIWAQFCEHFALTDYRCRAVIEFVRSTPQMGVVSAFTFGCNYSMARSFLVAGGVPFEEVTPPRWQRVMGCITKGDKNVTKAKAQQLFPAVKVTHGNADALLIAEYVRRAAMRGE